VRKTRQREVGVRVFLGGVVESTILHADTGSSACVGRKYDWNDPGSFRLSDDAVLYAIVDEFFE